MSQEPVSAWDSAQITRPCSWQAAVGVNNLSHSTDILDSSFAMVTSVRSPVYLSSSQPNPSLHGRTETWFSPRLSHVCQSHWRMAGHIHSASGFLTAAYKRGKAPVRYWTSSLFPYLQNYWISSFFFEAKSWMPASCLCEPLLWWQLLFCAFLARRDWVL